MKLFIDGFYNVLALVGSVTVVTLFLVVLGA